MVKKVIKKKVIAKKKPVARKKKVSSVKADQLKYYNKGYTQAAIPLPPWPTHTVPLSGMIASKSPEVDKVPDIEVDHNAVWNALLNSSVPLEKESIWKKLGRIFFGWSDKITRK